jgi:hypothetical protein
MSSPLRLPMHSLATSDGGLERPQGPPLLDMGGDALKLNTPYLSFSENVI